MEVFVALNVDEIGHGNSGGTLSRDDPNSDQSLVILAAVQWAESQPYIDTSAGIGLVGHSMGAGAIQSTAMEHNIRALVLIGGSINDEAINDTYPQHILVTLGQQDAKVLTQNQKF